MEEKKLRNLILKSYTWAQAHKSREEGQGVVEYGLVVGLVSLVLIAALVTVGEDAMTAVGNAITAALP
jgi:Flp pilus assembly pilin Flp